MTFSIHQGFVVSTGLSTSKSKHGPVGYAIQRLPTDPYYYGNVDITNMVVGSVWMLGYYSNGVFTELDSGTAASANFTISNVPAYGSQFLMELRVRKASGGNEYKPYTGYAYHTPSGVTIYVSQIFDPVQS